MKKLAILTVLILTFCILIVGCGETKTVTEEEAIAQITEQLKTIKPGDIIELKGGLLLVVVKRLPDACRLHNAILGGTKNYYDHNFPQQVAKIIFKDSREEWRKVALKMLTKYS